MTEDISDTRFIYNVLSHRSPATEHNVERLRTAYGFTKKRFRELLIEMQKEFERNDES